MPDTVLRFINPTSAPTPPKQEESPVLRMHHCVRSAKDIEQMAERMDNLLAERDLKVDAAKKECSQRTANADEICSGGTSAAVRMLSFAKSKAEAEEKRLQEAAKNTLDHFKLSPRNEGATPQQVTETTQVLEERLKSAYQDASRSQESLKSQKNKVKEHPWGFGCGGLIVFAILCSFAHGLIGLVIVLLIPAGIIYYAISVSRAGREARNLIIETSLLLTRRSKQERDQTLRDAQSVHDEAVTQAEAKRKHEAQEAINLRNELVNHLQSTCKAKCSELNVEMDSAYTSVTLEIRALSQGVVHGSWSDQAWKDWKPSQAVPGCLRIGTATPDMPRYHFYFSNTPPLAIPALVDYEAGKGVVIAASGALTEAREMAQSAILRLLATVPPASVRFVMIDPVSLGGNVARFMALEKYEASLIGGKAWSDARHIEQALSEVTEHMETVIQKYLLGDYKSIAEYNVKARVKEAYRIVVIFDFPVNFTEGTAKRLISIMRNGPRCGVFPIILADNTKPLPYGVSWKDLTQFAMVLQPSDAPAAVLTDVPLSIPQVAASNGQGMVDAHCDDDKDKEEDEDE